MPELLWLVHAVIKAQSSASWAAGNENPDKLRSQGGLVAAALISLLQVPLPGSQRHVWPETQRKLLHFSVKTRELAQHLRELLTRLLVGPVAIAKKDSLSHERRYMPKQLPLVTGRHLA